MGKLNNQFFSVMEQEIKRNGGARPNAGRKSKAEEQQLIEKLTPLEATAHEKLKENIELGKDWAIKMFFEYMYGKPKQMIEQKNINYDAGILTDDEIKKINDNIESTY